ncbi:hypothetical protein DRQ36_07785, partial [bacterium]
YKAEGFPKLLIVTNTIHNKWIIPLGGPEEIVVNQYFNPASPDTFGLIRVFYEIINNGLMMHTAGLEHKWDININGRDDAPVAIPGAWDSVNCTYDTPMPGLFLAAENGLGPSVTDPGLVARGLINQWDATRPDFLAYGEETDLIPSVFSITSAFGDGAEYDLSAVLLRWDVLSIPPGEKRDIITYYGLGDATIQPGSLYVQKIIGGDWTVVECELGNNPQEFQFFVGNRSPDLTVFDTVWVHATYPTELGSLVIDPTDPYDDSLDFIYYDMNPGDFEDINFLFYAWTDTCGPFYIEFVCSTNTAGIDTFHKQWVFNIPCPPWDAPITTFISPTSAFTACTTGDGFEIWIEFDEDDGDTVGLDFLETVVRIVADGCTTFVDRTNFDDVEWRFGGLFEDTLIIRVDSFPTFFFGSGDTIEVCVVNVEDEFGCADSNICQDIIVDPDPPVIWMLDPPPDSITNLMSPTITIGLIDSLAGLDTSTVIFSVNGTPLNPHSPGAAWDGFLFKLTYDTPSPFPCEEWVDVCVLNAEDITDAPCGPNAMEDSCWRFFVDYCAPGIDLVVPEDGSIISCETLDVILFIDDSLCVDTTAGIVAFEPGGPACTLATWDSVTWACSTITIHNVPLPIGDVILNVTEIQDIMGNMAALRTFFFTVDTAGPVPDDFSLSPPDGGWTGPNFMTEVLVYEESGIDSSSITWRVWINGVGPSEYTWDPHYPTILNTSTAGCPTDSHIFLTFNNMTNSLGLADGDTVTFCVVRCDDIATLCGANNLVGDSLCWTYFVDAAGPTAELIWPEELSISKCNPLDPSFAVKLLLEDPAGINELTIDLTIDGSYHTVVRDGDTDTFLVIISMAYPWPFCPEESVVVRLESVADSFGNLSDTYEWYFWSDSTAPFSDSTTWQPYSGEPGTCQVVSPYDTLVFVVDPGGCGWLNHDSLVLTLNIRPAPGETDIFGYGTEGYWLGDTFYLPITMIPGVDDGDTICVNIAHVEDSLMYMARCGANEADDLLSEDPCSWCLLISAGGPIITRTQPLVHYVSCPEFAFAWQLADDDGIDTSSVVISVWSESSPTPTLYTWPTDMHADFPEDSSLCTLYLDIDLDDYTVAMCETVWVRFEQVYDMLGVGNEATSTWWVLLDTTEPCPPLEYWPAMGETLHTRTPYIWARVLGDCAPVYPESLHFDLYIDGDWVWYSDTFGIIGWRPMTDTAYFAIGILPDSLQPTGCDSVTIKMRNTDDTDLLIDCPLNSCEFEWHFFIDCNGPEVVETSPSGGGITGGCIVTCPQVDSLVFVLDDFEGLQCESVWVACSSRVNGIYDVWDWPSGALHCDGTTISAIPLPAYSVEDTYDVWLYAEDLLANPLEVPGDTYHYYFVIDHTPPGPVWFSPNCHGDSATSTNPTLWFFADDLWGQVDPGSWCVDFENPTPPDWITVCFDSAPGAFELYDDSVGIHTGMVPSLAGIWSGGDIITFYVSRVCDVSDTCAPNCRTWPDTCGLALSEAGPVVRNIWPGSNGVLGCPQPDTFIFTLCDDEGVNAASIELFYRDCTGDSFVYTLDSATVLYYSYTAPECDTLWFQPPSILAEGCTLWLHFEVDDILGNGEEDNLFWFVYDYTPPGFTVVEPLDSAWTFTPDVIMTFPDNIAGVDTTSVTVSIVSWPCDTSLSFTSPQPDTLEWRMNTDLGIPETLILSFYELEPHCLTTGDTVCMHVLEACDENIACEVCTLLDTTWCFVIAQGGPVPVIVHPVPPSFLCPEDSLIIEFYDIDGIDTTNLLFIINEAETLFSGDPNLDWTLSATGDTALLVYLPPTPGFDTTDVELCVEGLEDLLGIPMVGMCWSFRVDLLPPLPEYISPASPCPDNQPDIVLYVVDSLSPINPECFRLWVDDTTYVHDDSVLVWLPDSAEAGTLVWSAVLAGDTLLSGDTVHICLLEACDSTGCLYDNYLSEYIDSFCWELVVSEGVGPVVDMLNPPDCDMAISCSTSFQLTWSVTDADGIAESSIRLIYFDGTTVDTFTIDSPEVYMVSPTVLAFEVPAPTGPGGIWVFIDELDDLLGNPAVGTDDTCNFIIDWDAPYVVEYWPADSETLSTPYPLLWFIVEDSSWFVDTTTGHIIINGTVWTTTDDEVWWNGDTLFFQPTVPFEGGDTITFCIDSVADSTVLCEPNWLETECHIFYINADGPHVELIFPDTTLDPLITFCDSGAFWLLTYDAEGLDTSEVVVIFDGSDTAAWADSPGRFELRPDGVFPDSVIIDTVLIWPIMAYDDGDTVCLELIEWPDTLGNPAFGDYEWCAVVDLAPPVLDTTEPAVGETVYNWQPTIFAVLHDSLSWVGHGCIEFHITQNGIPYGAGTYYDGDPELRWSDSADTLFFTPDTFFEEFAEICIDLTVCDSTTIGEPFNCAPNETTYHWCFIIGDDDTTGPEVVVWDSCEAIIAGDTAFSIMVALGDVSGVFDDGTTDTLGQGLLAHFLADPGSGFPDYWLPMDMSAELDTLGISPGDSLYWAWTTPGAIPGSEIISGMELCYEIWAHDNDFDFDNPDDRQLAVEGTLCCNVVNDIPPGIIITVAPDGDYVSCRCDTVQVELHDDDNIIADSLILTVNGMPYIVGDPEIDWDPGYSGHHIGRHILTFDLDEPDCWEHGDIIDVCIQNIFDEWGNQTPDSCWEFYIDFEPPEAWCLDIADSNVDIFEFDSVAFHLFDIDAGVNPNSIELVVHVLSEDGAVELDTFDINDTELDYDPSAGILVLWVLYSARLQLARGDSVCFELSYAEDLTTICDPNASEQQHLCCKFIKPETRCFAEPQPFTPPPPTDGYNDEVEFDYPGRYDTEALVKIYDMRSRLVAELGPSTGNRYIWDGYDLDGVPARPGVYMYVIEQGGEVICSGTVVLAR